MGTHLIRAAALSTLLTTGAAMAGGPEVWSYDLSSTGGDVFFTSPTNVDPSRPSYLATSTVETVIIEGLIFGFIPTGEIDVTDELPPEFLVVTGEFAGPAPFTIADTVILYPEPPADPGIAADVLVQVDAEGFGQLSITDVILGEVTVDVPGFGMVDVELTRIRVVGSVEVDPGEAIEPADLDGDGVVDTADLLILLAAWGPCSGECVADIDGDGAVGTTDLLALLAAFD